MALTTKLKCITCGSFNVSRKGVDCGYSTASELNRPSGAKGRDEFAVIETCDDCGSCDLAESPLPCHICGNAPITGCDLCNQNHEVTGMFEWVPGMPNAVNLCANPACLTALNNKIKAVMDAAFEEGGFE